MINSNNNLEQRNEDILKIPLRVLRDRTLAVLEAIVEYLKEEKHLKYVEIAKLLNRDQRTIWTVYNRAKKKRKK
jgi:DNA-directed RNA polymerase specialized sigma24 family protein